MKKISILFISVMNFALGQSVTILPNYLTKNSSSGFNDIELNRYSNVYGVVAGRTASGTDTAPTNTLLSTELFRIGGGGYANGGFTPTRASIGFWTAESWTTSANGTKMVFSTTANGTALQTGKMLIDHNGNIGMGTMTPLARLHLSGAETEKMRLENTTVLGSGINSEIYFKTGNFFTGAIKTIGVSLQAARMGLFTFAGINSQDLEERLTIMDGGNVGIGITSPEQILDVNGRARIRHNVNTAGIWMSNSTNSTSVADGAFYGMKTDTEAGVWIGNAWRWWVNNSGNMTVGGTVTASCGVLVCSDLRYKKNITSLNNSLENILKINGVRYDFKKEEFPERNFTDKNQIGFIAQEIEKIFPEMVMTDEKGYKSVDYARLTPVLVEAMKELKIMNDELKLKNQKLESRLDRIEAVLNK